MSLNTPIYGFNPATILGGMVVDFVRGIGPDNPARGGRLAFEQLRQQRAAILSAAPPPMATPPIAAPPVYQTPEGILREVFEKRPTFTPGGGNVPKPPSVFDDLLRRPSPDIGTRPPTTWNPNAPPRTLPKVTAGSAVGVLARAAGLLGGLLWPTPTADSDLGYEAPAIPPGNTRPQRRPVRPNREPQAPQPLPFPGTPADLLPKPAGRPDPTLRPASRPGSLPRTVLLPMPRPSPRAAPSPTATRGGSTRFDPTFLFLPVPKRPDRAPDRVSANQPGQPSGIVYRTPVSDRRPLTAPLPKPLAFRSPEPPSDCTCTRSSKPKRKRKPRTVCYRGTFTETRSSTAKVRKEQIPCQ